jgi:hypothetical protein
MQQFKFHYRMKNSVISDETGVMLPSLEEAHRYALRLISKTVSYARAAGDNIDSWQGWFVDISAGERDEIKLVVLFPNSRNADYYHSISRIRPVRSIAS